MGPGNATNWRQVYTTCHLPHVATDIGKQEKFKLEKINFFDPAEQCDLLTPQPEEGQKVPYKSALNLYQ